MAIGSAPEIGAKFVELADWPAKVKFLREWRAIVGDDGVGGWGTLVRRERHGKDERQSPEARYESTLSPDQVPVCGVHEAASRD